MNKVEKDIECGRVRNHPDGSGAMCRYIKDGKEHICSAYISITGKDPVTGEEYSQQWDCADVWMVRGVLEAARTNRGQTAAIEGLRNNVDIGNRIIHNAMQERLTNGSSG